MDDSVVPENNESVRDMADIASAYDILKQGTEKYWSLYAQQWFSDMLQYHTYLILL